MCRDRVNVDSYSDEKARQFVEDMLEAGFEPYHYHGRFMWEGPAVNADDAGEVMAETNVVCQTDGMGLGVVVYPRRSAKRVDVTLEEQEEE